MHDQPDNIVHLTYENPSKRFVHTVYSLAFRDDENRCWAYNCVVDPFCRLTWA